MNAQTKETKKTQPKSKKKTAPAKASGVKRKAVYCWWAAPVIALCAVIIAFAAMLALKEYVAYASFETKVQSALNEKFYEGVCVDNYEMTGFGLNDALEVFDSRVEK